MLGQCIQTGQPTPGGHSPPFGELSLAMSILDLIQDTGLSSYWHSRHFMVVLTLTTVLRGQQYHHQ